MDEKRKGEIAVLVIKEQMRGKQIKLKPIKERKLRRNAKFLGISAGEAREFAGTIIRELVEKNFPLKKDKKGKKKK